MNIFPSLIPATVGIQPHLAWMLANVPGMITVAEDREKVQDVLEDLNLRYSTLSGKVIERESRASCLLAVSAPSVGFPQKRAGF